MIDQLEDCERRAAAAERKVRNYPVCTLSHVPSHMYPLTCTLLHVNRALAREKGDELFSSIVAVPKSIGDLESDRISERRDIAAS
jgi:hypothetical protein